MKCVKCHKRFNSITNHCICPFCGLNHYEYFNIGKNHSKISVNSSKSSIFKRLVDDNEEEEDEITINRNYKYKEKAVKIEEDRSYEEFDSYNWIDPKNKSKREDFDDEDDE